MSLYSVALFIHVVGALGFFMALGLEWFNLMQLQRTTTVEEVDAWFATTNRLRGLAGISMLLILVAGFYMTFAAWGGADWINVAFGVLILQGVVAGVVTSSRMRAIKKLIATEQGELSPALAHLLHRPLLAISLWTRIGMALGIVFLMTVKPALVASLIVIGVGIVGGFVVALLTRGATRGSTNRPTVVA